jgi:adenylyltransferase/sulfurtransferase
MLLPDVGPEGQDRLSRAHAIIVGTGALGCAASDMLARAGVGTLTLIDRDLVEHTNLQRQCLFTQRDADESRPKALAAAERLCAIDPDLVVRPVVAHLSPDNADDVFDDAHDAAPLGVIVDATDNFETRFLLNDLAIERTIPLAYAGVVGTSATRATIVPGRTPCLRCLMEDPPEAGDVPTCDTAGVLGPAVMMIAAAQASEALKILIGREGLVLPGVLTLDPWRGVFETRLADARPRAGCPCCAERRFDFLHGRRASRTLTLCGQGAVQIVPGTPGRIALDELASRLIAHGEVASAGVAVRARLAGERGDDGTPLTITIFEDGRAIVHGTRDADRARAIHARYVGV